MGRPRRPRVIFTIFFSTQFGPKATLEASSPDKSGPFYIRQYYFTSALLTPVVITGW
jgi:hypothetical protein